MLRYNMFDAKQHFSKIIEQVNTQHETCIISKSGKAVAKIIPINRGQTRKLGLYKGRLTIPDDFDAPLPNEIIDSFYNDKDL